MKTFPHMNKYWLTIREKNVLKNEALHGEERGIFIMKPCEATSVELFILKAVKKHNFVCFYFAGLLNRDFGRWKKSSNLIALTLTLQAYVDESLSPIKMLIFNEIFYITLHRQMPFLPSQAPRREKCSIMFRNSLTLSFVKASSPPHMLWQFNNTNCKSLLCRNFSLQLDKWSFCCRR